MEDNERIIDVTETTEETPVKEEKKKVFDKVKDLGKQAKGFVKGKIDYCKENPEEAAEKALGGAVVLGLGILGAMGIHESRKLDRTVYSDDIQECVELKHKLNNKEKMELDYRVKTGQTKIEALNDMHLVK